MRNERSVGVWGILAGLERVPEKVYGVTKGSSKQKKVKSKKSKYLQNGSQINSKVTIFCLNMVYGICGGDQSSLNHLIRIMMEVKDTKLGEVGFLFECPAPLWMVQECHWGSGEIPVRRQKKHNSFTEYKSIFSE